MESSSSNAVTPAQPNVKRVALEEPVAREIHTGVGNIRGWAVASDGITKVEIWIDGVYAFDAPYGGERGDVGSAFPEIEDSANSGFGAAYNYSNLSAGSHSITAVAYTGAGETKDRLSSLKWFASLAPISRPLMLLTSTRPIARWNLMRSRLSTRL